MTARRELFEIKAKGEEDDLPKVQGDAAIDNENQMTLPPGTVVFSMEQLTLLALSVLILVVIAFLVGSYVSGKNERVTPVLPVTEVKVIEAPEQLLPDEHGEPPLPPVYEKPPDKPAQGEAPAGEGRYTLQVIRFNLEDRAVAVSTVERLQKYGYAPVFLETHGNELSVCVGRFEDKKDKKALMWREEIRNIHSAYRHCDFVPVKPKG